MRGHLLDVVVDAIEQSALVDDEGAEVLEELGQLGDRLGDVDDLAIAAVDGCGRVADRGSPLNLALRLSVSAHAGASQCTICTSSAAAASESAATAVALEVLASVRYVSCPLRPVRSADDPHGPARTLEIDALLPPEHAAELLDFGGCRDLSVASQSQVAGARITRAPQLALDRGNLLNEGVAAAQILRTISLAPHHVDGPA